MQQLRCFRGWISLLCWACFVFAPDVIGQRGNPLLRLATLSLLQPPCHLRSQRNTPRLHHLPRSNILQRIVRLHREQAGRQSVGNRPMQISLCLCLCLCLSLCLLLFISEIGWLVNGWMSVCCTRLRNKLSYHPIFLRPCHFLKLVSFLGSNWTKSASVCPWLLRGAIYYLNTIQYNSFILIVDPLLQIISLSVFVSVKR